MASRIEQSIFRHIIDVDGLLLGIADELVQASFLMTRAGIHGDRRLVRLVGERVIELTDDQPVMLREDEVAFFRSVLADNFAESLRFAA
jgi:hypothetical protein